MAWTLCDALVRAFPWEHLPDDRPRLEKAARRLVKDPRLSKAERDLIALHWLPQEDDDLEPDPAFGFPDLPRGGTR